MTIMDLRRQLRAAPGTEHAYTIAKYTEDTWMVIVRDQITLEDGAVVAIDITTTDIELAAAVARASALLTEAHTGGRPS